MSNEVHELLTSADVAKLRGWSVAKVNRLAANGELPIAAKAPGLRGANLFRRADVEPTPAGA